MSSETRRRPSAHPVPVHAERLDHHGRVRERPRPPWHPVPLSEVVSLIGIVLMGIGLARGTEAGALLVAAGLGVAVLGVAELCVREHLGAHRSHTTFLAFALVVVGHTALVLLAPVAVVGPAAIGLDLVVLALAAWGWHELWQRALRRAADGSA